MRNYCRNQEAQEQLPFANVIFNGMDHKLFFMENLHRCRELDSYHLALLYCLGIDESTRVHINNIYNFKTGSIKIDCLQEGWQTSGSVRVVRLAFNLYTNITPSVYDLNDTDEQLKECGRYAVEEIFCCSYAKYFWQAVQLRYPEYCD
uniref:DUF6075 family protein n=1 Tax=Acetatifactor sp. TaxID=1872090 RepID=UPI0040578068